METHRLFTFVGLALLIVTFAIFYTEEPTDDEFSLAYVTGIAMIVMFMASLAVFNKDRWSKK